MKHLLLLRHAKSSWINPQCSDFDRPLAPRAKHVIPLMGRVLNSIRPSLEKVFSSPAKRAIETSRGVIQEISRPPVLEEHPPLYLAELSTFLKLTHSLSPEINNVMFVGHNPGITSFCDWLCFGDGFGSIRLRTANLAWLELDIKNWEETSSGCGELRALIPSKLIKSLLKDSVF
jgi:phosphohistidine phosphatase